MSRNEMLEEMADASRRYDDLPVNQRPIITPRALGTESFQTDEKIPGGSRAASLAKTFLAALDETHADSGLEPVPTWAQVLNVVGEAGEFAEAYRRYTGHARRPGSVDEVRLELADVIISAYVAAERLGVDLDAAIEEKGAVVMSRGFRDSRG